MPNERPRPRVVPLRPLLADRPPPPEPAGDIGVLATMDLGERAQWLRVGIAHVEADQGGASVLCVKLGAIPIDRLLYIPLRDVLTCAGIEPDLPRNHDPHSHRSRGRC